MTDKIELIGNSLIQHGKENNRIYLMKLEKKDCPSILNLLNNLAVNDGYTKIIAKVPAEVKDLFLNDGYEKEAYISKFYNGKEDVYFLSKYFSKERQTFTNEKDIFTTIKYCIEKKNLSDPPKSVEKFLIKKLGRENISQIIKLYKSVFLTYPFPIFDGNYILKTMRKNIDYYGIFEKDNLVAISSSEMDLKNLNTEMTDFATLPEYKIGRASCRERV